MSLRATLSGNYRNKKGNKVYTYIVSASNPTELAAYKAAQEAKNVYRFTEKNEPLFFLTEFDAQGDKRLIEPVIDLVITTNNNVVVDETRTEQALMSEIKSHLGLEIAKAKAANWGRRAEAPARVPASTTPSTQGLPTPQEIEETTQTVNQPLQTVGAGQEDIEA